MPGASSPASRKRHWKDVFERAFQQFERETVAAHGSYATPLASVGRGTMRGKMIGDDALEVEIDVPTGAAGDAVIAAHEDAGIVVRPFLDADRSEGTPIPREDGSERHGLHQGERAGLYRLVDRRAPRLAGAGDPGSHAGRACAVPAAPRGRRLARWL